MPFCELCAEADASTSASRFRAGDVRRRGEKRRQLRALWTQGTETEHRRTFRSFHLRLVLAAFCLFRIRFCRWSRSRFLSRLGARPALDAGPRRRWLARCRLPRQQQSSTASDHQVMHGCVHLRGSSIDMRVCVEAQAPSPNAAVMQLALFALAHPEILGKRVP